MTSQSLAIMFPQLQAKLSPTCSTTFQAIPIIFESLLQLSIGSPIQLLPQHILQQITQQPTACPAYILSLLHNNLPPLHNGPLYIPIYCNNHWSLIIFSVNNHSIQTSSYADPLPPLHNTIRHHLHITIGQSILMLLAFRSSHPSTPTPVIYSNDPSVCTPSITTFLTNYTPLPLPSLTSQRNRPLLHPCHSYLYVIQYIQYHHQGAQISSVSSSTVSALRHKLYQLLRPHFPTPTNQRSISSFFPRTGIG